MPNYRASALLKKDLISNSRRQSYIQTLNDLESALAYISPNDTKIQWLKMLTAAKSAFGDDARSTMEDWSQQGDSYNKHDFKAVWKSLNTNTVGIGILINEAKAGGWKPEQKNQTQPVRTPPPQTQQAPKPNTTPQKQRLQQALQTVLNTSQGQTTAHPYCQQKGITGEQLTSIHHTKLPPYTTGLRGDLLAIPLSNTHQQPVALQLIDENGEKRLVASSEKQGAWYWLNDHEPQDGNKIIIAEGYATAETLLNAHQAMYEPCHVAMAIDAYNLLPVAQALRERYPNAEIIIAGDNDHSQTGQEQAHKAAKAINAFAVIPTNHIGDSKSTDWNDVYLNEVDLPNDPHNTQKALVTVHGLITRQINQAKQGIVPDEQNTIHIQQKYIGDTLKNTLDLTQEKAIFVKSDLGTGKTSAIKAVIAENDKTLYITPRISLATDASKRLELDVYLIDGANPERLVCTVDSLEKTIKDIHHYDYVFIDEPETLVGHLISPVIDRPSYKLDFLRKVIDQAKRVIYLDAFIGDNTHLLSKALNIEADNTLTLKNKHQNWQDHSVEYCHSNPEGITKLCYDLIEGKKIYIACSSKKQAEQINALIKRQAPHYQVALVTKNTREDNSIKECFIEPNKFCNYQVLIASPTLGTGVSIDQQHFDKTYLFVTSNSRTGTTRDALQQMARVRHIKDKQITVCLYNIQTPEQPREVSETAQYRVNVINALGKKYGFDPKTEPLLDTAEERYIRFKAQAEHNIAQDKANFEANLKQLIADMGIREHNAEPSHPIAIELAKKAKDIAKYDLQEQEKQDLKAAPIIDEDRKQELQLKLKRNQNLDQQEQAELKRHSLEDDYLVNLDDLDDFEFDELLKKDRQGIAKQAREFQALTADKDDIDIIVKAALIGVGKDQKFKEDLGASNKPTLMLKRKLMNLLFEAIGLEVKEDGTVWIDQEVFWDKDTLKGREQKNAWGRFRKQIEKHRKVLKAHRLAQNKINWKESHKVIAFYLNLVGIRTKQKRIRKEKIRTYTCRLAELNKQPVLQLVNQYAQIDKNWVQSRIERIKAEQLLTEREIVSLETIQVLGLTDTDLEHISLCLRIIPTEQHQPVMEEYILIYPTKRQQANLYLLNIYAKQGGKLEHGVPTGKLDKKYI